MLERTVASMAQNALTVFGCVVRRNLFPIFVMLFAVAIWLSGHYEIAALCAVAAAPAMPGKQKQLAPFRYNTRTKIRPIGKTRAFTNNTQLEDVPLLNLGFGARIWIKVTGTMTCGGAGALADQGPWNLLKRIMLESNDGGVANVDFNGYDSYILSSVGLERGFRPDAAGAGATTPHVDIYRAGVANGANLWTLWYCVPINMSQGFNRSAGLIALQAREIQVALKIQTENVANVVTTATGFVGNLDFYIESYEVPPSGVALPELDIIHTFGTTQAINAVGYNDYEVPHLGTLLQLIHIVTVNGVRSDAIDRWELTFNDNDTPRKVDRALMRLRSRLHTGVELPVGVYVEDFCQGGQNLFDDDMPDVVDTRNIALIQSRIYVQDTAVLGANNNNIRTIRRVLAAARVAS